MLTNERVEPTYRSVEAAHLLMVILDAGDFVTPYVMKPPSGNVLVQTFGCIAVRETQ